MDALSALVHLIPMNDTARLLVTADTMIELIVARSEQSHKLVIETYPLGAEIDVTDLVKLFDSLGLLPGPVHPPLTQRPASPTTRRMTRNASSPSSASPERVACPECGKTYNQHGLEVHIGRAHKKPAPEPDTCEVCGVPYADHARCADCALPIGEGHPIGPSVGPGGLNQCRVCSDSEVAERHTLRARRVLGDVPLRAA